MSTIETMEGEKMNGTYWVDNDRIVKLQDLQRIDGWGYVETKMDRLASVVIENGPDHLIEGVCQRGVDES